MKQRVYYINTHVIDSCFTIHVDSCNLCFRLFCGIDEVYYIFLGRLSNLCTLNRQYGLTEKNTSEALFVIKAYWTLRDRGPYPADQVIRCLEGSFAFAFVVYDTQTFSVFSALSSDGGESLLENTRRRVCCHVWWWSDHKANDVPNHLLLSQLVSQRHKKQHLREKDMWFMKCLMLCDFFAGSMYIVRSGLRVLNIPRTTWRQCRWLTAKVWYVELTSKWMLVLRSMPSLGEELKLTGLSLIPVDFFF